MYESYYTLLSLLDTSSNKTYQSTYTSFYYFTQEIYTDQMPRQISRADIYMDYDVIYRDRDNTPIFIFLTYEECFEALAILKHLEEQFRILTHEAQVKIINLTT
jgi:hypothetical protein